jgi:hypothetical protein
MHSLKYLGESIQNLLRTSSLPPSFIRIIAVV